jgi:hypothetical protein
VPTKIVLKVGFLERDFERDLLAEKRKRTKMGEKIHCAVCNFTFPAIPGKDIKTNVTTRNYWFCTHHDNNNFILSYKLLRL